MKCQVCGYEPKEICLTCPRCKSALMGSCSGNCMKCNYNCKSNSNSRSSISSNNSKNTKQKLTNISTKYKL